MGWNMKIIERDFGKKTRQAVRDFRQRLTLGAVHEANIKSNPVPYLERAGERIFQLEKALFEAAQVFTGDEPGSAPVSAELVQVPRDEYERLLRGRDLVAKALAELASDEEL